MRNRLISTLLALGTCASALAGDAYVDAINGDDQNTGTSWSDAWRTISHAVASTAGGEVLHLAPGVHDTTLGEVFPINLGGRTLVGAGDATVLDGGGAAVTLLVSPGRLEGLWLRNADVGASYPPILFEKSLADVSITDMSDRGIQANVFVPWMSGYSWEDSYLRLDRARIERCGNYGVALVYNADAPFYPVTYDGFIVCRDSQVRDCGTAFLATNDVASATAGGSAQLIVERCTMTGNGRVNAGSTFYGPVGGAFRSCLIAANGDGIYEGSAWDCTIADNTGSGIIAQATPGVLVNCIVHGNNDDVAGTMLSASYSLIGEGYQQFVHGNVSGDPFFVDRVAGDFRLRWSSPCVDGGNPNTPPDALDLVGRARSEDGDLDHDRAPDRGAYELAPLAQRGVASPGGTLEFELWGPMGSPSLLWFHRGEPLSQPIVTPIGELWLPRGGSLSLGTFAAGDLFAGLVTFQVPPVPALVGQRFSYQAVTFAGIPALTGIAVVEIAP